MKERPILFSTPMVQAILAGRKTQTRRIKGLDLINKNPNEWVWLNNKKLTINRLWDSSKEQSPKPIETYFIINHKITGEEIKVKCPHGQAGEVLWVRETHSFYLDAIMYKADEPSIFKNIKWKPSIFMPKIYARIWLKVTDISLQRVKEISAEDAIKEGIKSRYNHTFQETRYFDYQEIESEWRSPRTSFMSLWCSINGEENWDMNPWVWVIEFEVISTSGKPEAL